MKNLNLFVLIAVVFCSFLASCQKEEIEEIEQSVQKEYSKGKAEIILENLESMDTFDTSISIERNSIGSTSRSSGSTYTIYSETKTLNAGKWHRYSIAREKIMPGGTYTATVIPSSGDPDLYINGGTYPYRSENLRYISSSTKGGTSIDQLSTKLYDLKVKEGRLDFYVYGHTKSKFRLEVTLSYNYGCAFSAGRGNVRICDYMDNYSNSQSISSQSRNWKNYGDGYDAIYTTTAYGRKPLQIKGDASSLNRKGIDYGYLDLGKAYSHANSGGIKRLSWDMLLQNKAEIVIFNREKNRAETINFGFDKTEIIRSSNNTFEAKGVGRNRWVKVELFIDHTRPTTEFTMYTIVIDNNILTNWTFGASDSIEGLGFKGIKGTSYYIDNVCFETDVRSNPY